MKLRELNPKTLKRGPFAIDGLVLAGLGRVLEWEMADGILVRAGRNVRLTWAPNHKALVLLEGAKWGSPSKAAWDHVESQQDGRAAMRKFESWADRKAKGARSVKISTKGTPKWYAVPSHVARLDYASDKWGTKAEYTHDFGKGVRLYAYMASISGPAVWVLKGGRMTVTERGIVG